jgi:hypothetical protein
MGQQNIETAITAIRQALTASQNLCFESIKLLLKVSSLRFCLSASLDENLRCNLSHSMLLVHQ